MWDLRKCPISAQVYLALFQMKSKRPPGDDGITSQMINLCGTGTIESVKNLCVDHERLLEKR